MPTLTEIIARDIPEELIPLLTQDNKVNGSLLKSLLTTNIGLKADAAVTNPASEGSLIGLAKGLMSYLDNLLYDANGNLKTTLATGLNDAVDSINVSKMTKSMVYSDNISASITVANSTVIDITGYKHINISNAITGAGTWKFEIYVLEANSGTYIPLFNEAGTQRGIAISSPDNTSRSTDFINIGAQFIKVVPTLTGGTGSASRTVFAYN